MGLHTEFEITVPVVLVESLVVETIKTRREIQGDSFATADEAKTLCLDPLAHLWLVADRLHGWANQRHAPQKVKFSDYNVYGSSVVFKFRATGNYVRELAESALDKHLSAFIARSRTATEKEKIQLGKDLLRTVRLAVKTALGLSPADQLGYADDEAIRALVNTCWAQAMETTWA